MLVLALVLIRGTKIQSVDEYYLTHMEDIQEDSETVTISIKCDTLRQPENWEKLNKQLKDEKYVPNDGVILPETTYVLRLPVQQNFHGIQRSGHEQVQHGVYPRH